MRKRVLQMKKVMLSFILVITLIIITFPAIGIAEQIKIVSSFTIITNMAEVINPHSFLSPRIGIIMVKNLQDALIKFDTEEQGTASQIMVLIDLLKKEQPPVLFLESNVDPKAMETVSRETKIPIFKERIYSDEIGKKGQQVDTYIKLLEHNLRLIEAGLK